MTSTPDSCLGPDVLLAWVHGELPDGERAAALAHIESCDACREALGALARIATIAPAHETIHDHPPRPTRPLDMLGIGARLGRFRITRVLGIGGMGVVVAARDEQLQREVAIKLVRPDLPGAEVDLRLVREAQVLAALRHPNLVSVLDVGEVDGVPFLVMELVDGPNLRTWSANAKPALADVLATCVAAGRGLAALHAAGYLHRDIKPDNVVVARDGRVVVADFGLAKRLAGATGEPVLTNAGAIVGTPRYLAPECLAGEPGDERADLYAFAVMTLEVARTCTKALPPRVEAVLARGAARDPAARFPSVAALIAALLAALEPAPRGRWVAVPLALLVVAGGTWFASARVADRPPAHAPIGGTPRDAAIATAIGAPGDAPSDVPIDAPIDARLAAPSDARPRVAARADAPPDAAQLAPVKRSGHERELSIAYLREIGRRPLTAATAEAEVMAQVDGVCRKGVDRPSLGWEWGKVERRELVDVEHTDGAIGKQLLYQVNGQARRYLFDGALSTSGYLDVPVGALVLLCPAKERDDVVTPAGWQGDFIFAFHFGGPIAGPSAALERKPTYLVGKPHLEGGGWPHGDDVVLFLVKHAPDDILPTGRFEMGIYYLDATGTAAKLIASATSMQPVWVLAKYRELQERNHNSYPVLRVVEVRRTLFDPK